MARQPLNRALLLTLSLALAACQGGAPTGAASTGAGPASVAGAQIPAGSGVIRGRLDVDTGSLVAAGGMNYRLAQSGASGGTVYARGDLGTYETPVRPDGTFEVVVKGGGEYTLEGVVPDGKGGMTRAVLPTPVMVQLAEDPPIVDAASLVTRQTGSIQGLIELQGAAEGETPEGADVFLTGGTSVVGKAGETGRFALTNVAEGTWNVVVSKPGYQRQVVKGVVVRPGRPAMIDAPVVLVRETAAQSGVTGSVQSSDGKAIIGASVTLYPKDRQALAGADVGLESFTAVTDDQGRYALVNVPAGSYTLQVYRAFYQVPPRRSVTVVAGAPQDVGVTKLTSTVAYFGKVSGLVQDEAGNPLDGAVAQLDPPVTESQFTDATGKFTLDRILPGQYNLTVAAGGYKSVIVPVLVDNKPSFAVKLPAAIKLAKGSAKADAPTIVSLPGTPPAFSPPAAPGPAKPPVGPAAGNDDEVLPEDPLPKKGAVLPSLIGNPNVRLFRPDPTLPRIEEKQAQALAQRYLETHAGDEGLWPAGATLAPEPPLALRDGFSGSGPGSFEFRVILKGEAAGSLVVNTSKEMMPVPESTADGAGHRGPLLEAFRARHKREPKNPVFYRFSTFSWAVEDAEDRTYAKLAVDDFSFDAFRGGKRNLVELPGQRELVRRIWTAAESGRAPAPQQKYGLQFWGTDYYRRELTGVPYYTQHQYNGCAVGCGPTAWGMVYGYWEGRGFDTIAGAAADNTSNNANTRAMIEKVNQYVSTACSGTSGGTMWYDEPDGQKWGDDDRNLNVGVTMRYMSDYSEFSMFKHLKRGINNNQPPMLGFYDDPNTNGGGHAVTAYGYYQKDAFGWWDDVETMKVNSGWSSPRTLNLTLGDNGLVLKWVMRVNVSR